MDALWAPQFCFGNLAPLFCDLAVANEHNHVLETMCLVATILQTFLGDMMAFRPLMELVLLLSMTGLSSPRHGGFEKAVRVGHRGDKIQRMSFGLGRATKAIYLTAELHIGTPYIQYYTKKSFAKRKHHRELCVWRVTVFSVATCQIVDSSYVTAPGPHVTLRSQDSAHAASCLLSL